MRVDHVETGTLLAVLRHPSLWLEALSVARSLAPRRWWSRPPFLPLPDPEVLAWRTTTAYGAERPIASEDLVAYLRWRKRQRRTRG